jgi:DNA polymerase-1
MATIQRNKKAIIQKGKGLFYDPATFEKMHARINFHEAVDAQEVLDNIKPFEFLGRKFITFDTETHPHYPTSAAVPNDIVRRWVGKGSKSVPQDYPFCISICDGVNSYTLYDSIANNFAEIKKLAPLFLDASIEKIAHNTKYDMHMIHNAKMKIVGRLHDTVVLSKLANENRPSFELRALAEVHPDGIVTFEYMVDSYKQVNKVTDYRQIPKPLMTQYANADVWNATAVFKTEYMKLIEDELEDLYNTEIQLMVCLYETERRGMKLKKAYEAPLKLELQKLVDDSEKLIYDEAGKIFNINSTAQLYQVLVASGVDDRWIPRTDKGAPSLSADVLESLAALHNVSIVKDILEFRKNEKLLGTYATGIYAQAQMSCKVHGSINQTEATTGRMSITKPALQTLPKKNKLIRRAFIPDGEDYDLYFMDLDQVEYRIFAHYAKSKDLIDAIAKGFDVHAATAALIYDMDLEEFMKLYLAEDPKADSMRANGKTINFALIYGVGLDHLCVLLATDMRSATMLKSKYFESIPEAKPFIDAVHRVIKTRGFVKNLYGRRRRLTSNDCYKAPNSLIQGCAADYIKSKMLLVYKYLKYNKLKSSLVNIVHDEIIYNFYRPEESHLPYLRWLVSDFTAYRCPITAGVDKSSISWGDKQSAPDIGFSEPEDKGFEAYDVFNGDVFDYFAD